MFLCYKIAVAKGNTLVYEAGGELGLGVLGPPRGELELFIVIINFKSVFCVN